MVATAQLTIPDTAEHTSPDAIAAHTATLQARLESAIGVNPATVGPYLFLDTELRDHDPDTDPEHPLLPHIVYCACCLDEDAPAPF